MMLPLGLGNDICHIPRIYRILASRHGPRFVARVLTPAERQDPRPRTLLQCIIAQPRPAPHPPRPEAAGPPTAQRGGPGADAAGVRDRGLWEAAVFMAGRFAAKEAAIKAHPDRRLTFQSIRVRTRPAPPTSEPPGAVAAAAADADARSSGPPVAVIQGHPPGRPDTTALLSISHDGDYAAAVCLALQQPDDGSGSQ